MPLDAAMEWLRRLVGFNTVSARSNKPLTDYVAERLQRELGVKCAQITAAGDKTTLLATFGPQADGGVVLSAHADVVPTAGQDWRSPPFELTRKGDRLYGRGTCDMKGFIACVLALAPQFQKARLKTPLHLALSRDEEIGCVGVPDVLRLIQDSGMRPAAALVGEPTAMRAVIGHKGSVAFKTKFRGRPAHGSTPADGVSAIQFAARFVTYLENLEAEMSANAPPSAFEPPYGTINVGVINGGGALNIIPEHCELQWHYRPMPEEDLDAFNARINRFLQNELLPQMRRNGHPAGVVNTAESESPGLQARPSAATELVEKLTGEPARDIASIHTEAGQFQRAGLPAVVIGPGSISEAHKPNEFIEIAQMERCLRFLTNLAELAAS